MSISKRNPIDKPKKPWPDFPLFPHASGRWAKKVRGKLCYFGPWSDADGANAKWLLQRDYLLAGRKPPTDPDGITVMDLVNKFLTAKKRRLDSGEMAARSWKDYFVTFEKTLKV